MSQYVFHDLDHFRRAMSQNVSDSFMNGWYAGRKYTGTPPCHIVGPIFDDKDYGDGWKFSRLTSKKLRECEGKEEAGSGEKTEPSVCPSKLDPYKLTVCQWPNGRFQCTPQPMVGTLPVGRGASVLEAVGEWVIQNGIVKIKCSPPAILHEYKIGNDYCEIKFGSPDQRD